METTTYLGYAQALYLVPGELLDTRCVLTERCFTQSKESVTYHITLGVRMKAGLNVKKKPYSAVNLR